MEDICAPLKVLIPLEYKLSPSDCVSSLILYKLVLDQDRSQQMNCGIDG